MIDVHDDEALAKAAVAFAVGGEDPGFKAMFSGEASRELAERAMVSCIAMAMSGGLNGNASEVLVMATNLLSEAGSRAAMPLWEQVAEEFVARKKWNEAVMASVGRALMENSSSWSGWGNVLSVSKGKECKELARDAMVSAPPRLIGAMLYSARRKGHADDVLVKMTKKKFGVRVIGASVGGMSPQAKEDVRSLVCATEPEKREFDAGIEEDPFGEMEEAKWKPSNVLDAPSLNARFARRG